MGANRISSQPLRLEVHSSRREAESVFGRFAFVTLSVTLWSVLTIPNRAHPQGPAAEAVESSGPAASPGGTFFIQDPSGEWRAAPLESSVSESDDDVVSARDGRALQVPDYFVRKLRLDGVVTDVGVKLTADVTVEVVTPDRWFRVPLRFDQAILLDYQHQGTGEAAPDSERTANDGIAWFLNGGRTSTQAEPADSAAQDSRGRAITASVARLATVFR